MYYYGSSWEHSLIGLFLMIAFWAAIIAGVIWLVRHASKCGGNGTCCMNSNCCKKSGHTHALEILKERYARSEIGKEEFEVKRKDLSE